VEIKQENEEEMSTDKHIKLGESVKKLDIYSSTPIDMTLSPILLRIVISPRQTATIDLPSLNSCGITTRPDSFFG